MENYKDKYNGYLDLFESRLKQAVIGAKSGYTDVLLTAVEYAVLDGGKRVRPVLCMATADMLGVDIGVAVDYAVSVEMIHSYSLVHDDLPAMDNDDYRRGKLSTHKKYGEALGILAGDGLLTLASENVLSAISRNFGKIDSLRAVKAAKIIFECAGINGMVGGQAVDLSASRSIDKDSLKNTLDYIIENKTAKMIQAPILVASTLSGGKYYRELNDFGRNLGFLFQITDDILDEESNFAEMGKTCGKDKKDNKLTSVSVYGLDGAKQLALRYYEACKEILLKIDNNGFLTAFTESIYKRKH